MAREKFKLNPLRPNRTRFMVRRYVDIGRFTLAAEHFNHSAEYSVFQGRVRGHYCWYGVNIGYTTLSLTIRK